MLEEFTIAGFQIVEWRASKPRLFVLLSCVAARKRDGVGLRIAKSCKGIWAVALVSVLLAAWSSRADEPPPPEDLVKAGLVAETASVAGGATLWVALHLEVKKGWHIYWRNPGDSGLPTEINWKLPPGFSAGRIHWPVPEHFVQNGIGNYGYAGTTDLLIPITAPAALAAGQAAPLGAEVSWLACADICIPGAASLRLSLPVAARSAPDPAVAPLFAAARRKLPVAAPFETRFTVSPHDFRLLVPAAALAGLREPAATFFPKGESLIDAAAEPRIDRLRDGLELLLPKASAGAATPATLDGVLLLRGADGTERAFQISANPGPPAQAKRGLAWWQALLLAFAGGVVLNAMPCVFPILSLKLLSLAGQARGQRAEQLVHGLIYTAGVVVSFAALGGALIAFRASGQALGWGFQLQSPAFVALLAYLFFALGLSLSGALELGGSLAGAGRRLAGRSGLAGSFFTGVLATIVATPCTAPYMGAALGFAVLAPTALAIGIFLMLGLGLAAPYLVATLFAGWRRVLPKPGKWMEFVKQLLAFPLYGTVAWLVWVLIQQVGPGEVFGALFGLVLVAFAAWLYGQTRPASTLIRSLGTGFAVAGTAAAIFLAASLTPTGGGTAPALAAAHDGLNYEPFSTRRLSALKAEGKPVFVNMTASWCITCLANERVALDSEAVRKAFTERGVVPLKGDWTNQNPEITQFLQQFGRSGVPLYLFYPGKGEPIVLPQLLTVASVLDTLAKS
ncbi:MAG: thioredoxin family protein [Alphaproteobacteria bacterium]|nr:thioredoxin family protein [Alphaproteobacteria bacterium]